MFVKIRKSLGNKRNALTEEHVRTIAEMYGDVATGENAKLFDNDDFGCRRITVERPLRLNFQASPERIERLQEETAFMNLARSKKKGSAADKEIEEGQQAQEAILRAVRSLDALTLWTGRPAFEKALHDALKRSDVKAPVPVVKAILSALSERDKSADVCTDAKGRPEPDAELRANENVPLKEDVRVYFEREVLPHVPDTWIGGVTRSAVRVVWANEGAGAGPIR